MRERKREWMPLYSFLDRSAITAHLASRKDSPRNTAKLSTPMITQVFVRLRMVVSSLDISTKTMVWPKGVVRF